jgi:nucleoside 2-deoxyribosyltransferase
MPTSFFAKNSKGFFAYASAPHSIPATVKAAIESINKTQQATLVSWESLGIGGKYIIKEICDAIDDSDFFCADITTINPNVMFELGFAIARDKRIWLIREPTSSPNHGGLQALHKRRTDHQRVLRRQSTFDFRRHNFSKFNRAPSDT